MAEAPRSIIKRKLLIGEGVEEVRFFDALCKHLTIADVQVMQYGGKDNLAPFLKSLPNIPGFSGLVAVGLTRDADTSCDNTFQSVSDALRRANLPVPARPGEWADGRPRVGIYLLPDCRSKGMLEDLCLRTITEESSAKCVEEYFNCLKTTAKLPGHISKARVHAWLASRPRPDLRLGEAAQEGYWPMEHPSLKPIRDFIKSI